MREGTTAVAVLCKRNTLFKFSKKSMRIQKEQVVNKISFYNKSNHLFKIDPAVFHFVAAAKAGGLQYIFVVIESNPPRCKVRRNI